MNQKNKQGQEITLNNKQLNLFTLMWPLFIEVALYMFLSLVDVYALSQYNDVAAAAVGSAGQVINICTIVFTIASGASAVLISQALGSNNREKASRVAALAIMVNFISGLVIAVILVAFARPIMQMIGAEGAILGYAAEYLQIVGGFFFVQAVLGQITTIIRNHGFTKLTMYVSLGMNVVNTVLDLLFVLGWFGMPVLGVKGVAWATSFSKILGLIVVCIVLFRFIEKPSMFKLLRPFPKGDMKNLLKIGIPSALESFNYNLSQLVVTSIVLNNLTDIEIITKNYITSIATLFYIFAFSIGQASQILTGHKVGAKDFDGAYKQGIRAFGWAVTISVSLSVLGMVFSDQLIGFFTENSQVIQLGGTLLAINLVVELGRSSNLVIINSLRGAGDVLFPTVAAVFSMWLLSTLGAYVLAVPMGLGLSGLWIAFACDECFRGILMLFRWRSRKWETKRIKDEE